VWLQGYNIPVPARKAPVWAKPERKLYDRFDDNWTFRYLKFPKELSTVADRKRFTTGVYHLGRGFLRPQSELERQKVGGCKQFGCQRRSGVSKTMSWPGMARHGRRLFPPTPTYLQSGLPFYFQSRYGRGFDPGSLYSSFYRSLDQYDPKQGDLQNWLMRLARNLVIDDYRRRQRAPQDSYAE